MKLSSIETPVSSLSGIGPTMAKTLAKVGIFTVADLLSYWPRDFEDRTKKISISQFNTGKVHTIAQVLSHEYFGYGKMRTLRIRIDDGTGTAALVCFNRPFLAKTLPENSVISVTGKFVLRYGELQCTSFDAECIAQDTSIDDYRNTEVPNSKVLPIYPLTQGLTQLQLRKTIEKALNQYCKGIENEIPENIIQKRNLLSKNDAIFKMHKPENMQEALDAKKTLIYEELYNFQKTVLERAKQRKKNIETLCTKEPPKDFETSLSPRQKLLYQRLPFPLTEDQKKVIYEMNIDMDLSESQVIKDDNPFRMARLLQGDVGSGKTLTAFFLALRSIDYGGQVAILAPTEILSKQHAENASKILEPLNVRIAFLTGNINTAGRKTLLNALKSGLVDIVIGTHALFSQSVQYKNLRFVVIDEQHRFGVVQRSAILDKGRTSLDQMEKMKNGELPRQPDLLLMSATPIPQTLALTIFGDLDVSTIKTMPSGRKPITTHLTAQGNEFKVYEAVRQELQKGHQAYFVYPLIEGEEIDPQESENRVMPLKSAEEMYAFLSQQVYPEYKCALVHSKVDEEQQNEILNGFRDGSIQVLIATTVVEVGVDVPNATCMVIEGAERFGLAALHQLRGRVGRGSQQSYCFLIYSQKLSEIGKQRMKVLYSSNDGFFIAEEDLKLRGPGDINGIQQSGYFTLGIADPINDKEIMEMAREDILAEN